MKYSQEYYQKHKDAIRKAQKKYYDNHKHDFLVKYKHHRNKWDDDHRAYINEHSRLRSALQRNMNNININDNEREMNDMVLRANKAYLSSLHQRGII